MKAIITSNILHKYEKESSKLRIGGGSWTINLDWLAGRDIDKIVYETKEKIYRITYQEAIKLGFKRMLGGELKLVVPIKHWEVEVV